jgi:plastocyanin
MRRLQGSLAFLVIAGVVLAGCAGKGSDNSVQSSSLTPTIPSGAPTVLHALAPLLSSVTATGGDWVAPGTSITVTAAPPANAQGAVTYEWMIGNIAGVGPYPALKTNVLPLTPPGQSASMVLDQAGIYHFHCHPHPWMLSNVTVVDDGRAPETVTVHFVDGATLGEYHFVPENVTVPKGSTVVYENDGHQAHQTMLLHADAALAMLPLKAASGDVTVTGSGWQRIVVAMTDADGRVGYAEKDLYVAPFPDPLVKPLSGTIGPGVPSSAPGQVDDQISATTISFAPTQGGTLYLNITAEDPAYNASGGATPNQALIEAHLKKQGETQDTLTIQDKDGAKLTAKVDPATYVLTLKPRAPVQMDYSGSITVVYDPVPPAKPVPYLDETAPSAMSGMQM